MIVPTSLRWQLRWVLHWKSPFPQRDHHITWEWDHSQAEASLATRFIFAFQHLDVDDYRKLAKLGTLFLLMMITGIGASRFLPHWGNSFLILNCRFLPARHICIFIAPSRWPIFSRFLTQVDFKAFRRFLIWFHPSTPFKVLSQIGSNLWDLRFDVLCCSPNPPLLQIQ